MAVAAAIVAHTHKPTLESFFDVVSLKARRLSQSASWTFSSTWCAARAATTGFSFMPRRLRLIQITGELGLNAPPAAQAHLLMIASVFAGYLSTSPKVCFEKKS